MALSEPPHYLHPDFDPWKLKMDQIRDILIQHHVKTPTGIVRKQQLVDLFNQHIRPQVPEISEVEKDAELNDHENKASSSKTRHQLAKKEEEQTTAETAPPKSTRVKRASSKQRLDPEEPAEVKPKIERGSSRGKVSADRSDVESKTSVTGRGRKPRKTPVQSEDDSEPISKSLRVKREAKEKKKARSANFSDENPFQSGSESERKRSRSRSRTRKAKESDKRDHVFKVPAQPAFSKFMHTPLPEKGDPSKSSAHPKPRKIMPDEFPTPKPLHLNAPQSDMQDLLNNLRRNMGPIWLILSTVLLAYGIWAKEYQSLQVADAVEKMLHLHAGNIECSLSRDKAPLNSVEYRARRGISVNDLRSQLVQLKDDNVSDEDFGQYWDLALRELRRRSDRVIFEHGLTGEERVRSLRPQKSLGCRIRQALVSWVVKFRFFLFAMVASATGGFAIRSQVLKRRKEGRIVNGLVQNVLAKLSDQAHYHYVDPALFLDPFLPQTHLRDALLADVHSAARRQEIWDKVQAIVERNSNVRTSSQEVHGELHRVWEWVGPSGVLSQHGAGEAISQVDNLNHGVMSGSTRGRGVPKVPPRTGPHGSFFGLRRQDSEFLNPENSLYPSLSQDYQGYTQE
ncbi:inner nuclear membrane protein enriched at telomere/subtelomere region [Gamsiella multidivaricata]|nr:inner nuclear membrane protein enriched at telomere/subtelomere region [Gamsiella multidivaricata]